MSIYQRIEEALSGATRAYKKAYNKAKKSKSSVWDRYDAMRKQNAVPQSDERRLARRGGTGHRLDKKTAEVRMNRQKRDGLRP